MNMQRKTKLSMAFGMSGIQRILACPTSLLKALVLLLHLAGQWLSLNFTSSLTLFL